MRCYICNRETINLKRDPDGNLTAICAVCYRAINDCKYVYQDITEEDIKILKMSSKDFDKKSRGG